MPRTSARPGLLAVLACALASPLTSAAERIVSIGGAVTEILYALGAERALVAVDATSLYPAAADALPDVGYLRTLAPEPILALAPDLVLHEADAGPPETLAQLVAAGVRLVAIPDAPSVAGVAAKVRAVAASLDRAEQGEALVATIERDMAIVETELAGHGNVRPRVLFALQFDQGSVMAAGRGTAADAIIRLAGGDNVGAGFDGYKTVGAEALLSAAPDVVVTMDRALAGLATPAAALDLPVLALTPAAKTRRIVVMDGLLLLGFGPRIGLATRRLAEALRAN